MKHFIFFHGIGIRSFFWGPITPLLEEKNVHYSLIDLDFTSMDAAFNSALIGVKGIMEQYPDREIVMVGHSLGGLFAGYVAYELGEKIDKLIIVASGISPQKKKNESNFIKKRLKKMIMKLMFGGYMPYWVTQPMFFTKHTPKEVQHQFWTKTVREDPQFLKEFLNYRDSWQGFYDQPHFSGPDNVLCIINDRDNIMPKHASLFLKDHLNASHKIYKGAGHNDVVTSEKYNKNFVNDIISFSLI